MPKNNKQMKIVIVAVIVILLISSMVFAVRSSTSEPVQAPAAKSEGPAAKSEGPAARSEDVSSKEELLRAVSDLETIKDRIKNVEEGYIENYRSETNNGLTIVGTLMEQMIDVMISILKQPLVSEAISKRIVNKQDADEIAEYIEMLGQEVVKEVEQTQLLRCGKPTIQRCVEMDGLIKCYTEEGEGDTPEDNCEVYKFNKDKVEEGRKRAIANLYNKVLSVVEKTEERDKMYRITKNVSIDNYKQYSLSVGKEIDKTHIDNFPEQSKVENAALAHYKYLGQELKNEIGESINARELTEDEKQYITVKN